MKNTTKKILTPEEIAAIKAAAKILRKLQKKVDNMSHALDNVDDWLDELYKEAKIDICDEVLFIDFDS